MQLHDIIKKGSTDRSVTIRIIDATTGLPETAVEHNTSGIDLWYRREGAVKTSITEAALTALTDAHSDGGIEAVGDGVYRLDLPDAAFATAANYVDFGGTVTDMIVIGGRVRLVDYDPEDAVRMGQTALPNAAADAAGGLVISDSGGLDIDAKLATATSALATPTNITAGTITTVTTLTNLPTIPANWLTAAGTAADFTTEIQVGLATAASLTTVHSDLTDLANQVGADGDGLTAIPWNATWDAEVQSEVADALAVYDPPTNAEFEARTPAAAVITNLTTVFNTDFATNYNAGTDRWIVQVAAMNNGVLTSNAFDTGAITAASFAAGAIDAAAIAATALSGKGDWNIGKTGYTLTTADKQALIELYFTFDATATYGTADAGSLVKQVADNAGGSGLTAGGIADAVWDEPIAGHVGAGSTGEALSAAGGAGDPWITALPGAYGAGSAGKIIGDNINATISSRATQASVDTIDTEVGVIDGIVDAILADTGTDGVLVSDKTGYTLTTMPLTAAETRTAMGMTAADLDAQMTTAEEERADIVDKLGAWTGTGVNTILGAFKALLSKTASTPSDIGGTFSATTDSTEAIRDRGDAEWISGGGGGAADIRVYGMGGTNTYEQGVSFTLRAYAYSVLTGEPYTDWGTTPIASGDFLVLESGTYVVADNAVPVVEVANEIIMTFSTTEATALEIVYSLFDASGVWTTGQPNDTLKAITTVSPVDTLNANVVSVNGTAVSGTLTTAIAYSSATNVQEPDRYPLTLVRGKAYLVATGNQLTFFNNAPGLDTADAAYLTIRNTTTGTIVVNRQVSASIDTTLNKIIVELTAAQTLLTAGSEYRMQLELRHGSDYQVIERNKCVVDPDLAEA